MALDTTAVIGRMLGAVGLEPESPEHPATMRGDTARIFTSSLERIRSLLGAEGSRVVFTSVGTHLPIF